MTLAALLALGLAPVAPAASSPAPPVLTRPGVPQAPSDDDVERARAAQASTSRAVAALETELAAASAVADTAWHAVSAAAEDYAAATVARDEARVAAQDAADRERAAQVELETARDGVAALAMEAYRSGGAMDTLGAFLSADGFEDLLARTEAVERLGTRAERAVQRYRAADLVSRTLAARTQDALALAESTAAAADDALAAARAAQEQAEQQVASAAAERERLIVLLAEQRRTTVEVERARQDALDAERQARQEAAAAASRGVPAPTRPAGPGGTPPAVPGGTPAPPADPQPTTPATPTAPPTTPAPPSSAPNPPAPNPPAPTPTPPAPPAVTPPPVVAPPPAVTPAPPAPPASTPAPAPPASDPYGLGTGSQRGSAAQGQAAVDWALTQVGKPYVWGGTGPDGYDCSGLTSQAWRAAGLTINRTSRDQYRQVRKIEHSQLRPGDLVFYGSGNDPASITHVGMYVGGGQMVEASRPGVPVRVTPVRWSGTMPFAGRP